MIRIFTAITKYLTLIFMALYTFKCFSYFVAKNKKKRTSNLNKQVFYIFAIHLMCYMKLFLWKHELKFVLFYISQVFVCVMYMVIFHQCYKNVSRLITNNMVFLLMIGYIMLTRLDFQLAIRQAVMGTGALFATSFIPFILRRLKNIRKWNVFFGVTGLMFLMTVFIPGLGLSIYGSRNWIHIGSFTAQPMEFVKILFIFFAASSLVKANTMADIIINAVISVLFLLILIAEKDFGAMLIFYICYISMVYLATSRARFLIGGILAAVGAVAVGYILFKDTSLFGHVMTRVNAWKDPFADIYGGGYQLSESLFAIGTGGFIGAGLGDGMPGYIPVSESDFIFAAICEELGVIFGLSLILIYLSSFIAMCNIAMKCRSPFYKYITFGIAVCMIIQVLLNIGGVTKFIPSTGVTLPLISHGISSVFSTLIMYSIVQYTYILVNDEAEYVEKEKQRLSDAGEAEYGPGGISQA
ncbi:MAG: FtsW/RodA/SpoVE family cell cycle protein [Eubacterium sp.]|nr:FtsW/RodA/SpoVE family cell cycle protein [Eubacterium sp.]